MKKEIRVAANINAEAIDQLIKFYKETSKETSSELIIAMTGEKAKKGSLVGEADPVFLSYLVLIIRENYNCRVAISFEGLELTDRVFSLKDQLCQLIYLNPWLAGKIILRSKMADRETGEIQTITHNLSDQPVASRKFTPLIFTEDKNDIDKYFVRRYSQGTSDRLWKAYMDRLMADIVTLTQYPDGSALYDTEALLNLTFIETCIMSLLMADDLYENRNVNDRKKREIISRDREKINYFASFAVDISRGLKELSLNAVEHSSTGKGIISCRLFDARRMAVLKEKEEKTFTEQCNASHYLTIEMVDIGEESIRETYLKSFKDLIQDNVISDVGGLVDAKVIGEDYHFQDFFIVDIDKYQRLDHQQNKLISRFGLHYFTHIIKSQYNGFIRSQSLSEGFIAYHGPSNTDYVQSLSSARSLGTAYSCIVPVGFQGPTADKNDVFLKDKRKEATNINAFQKLDEYEIVEWDRITKSGIVDKRPIRYYQPLAAQVGQQTTKYGGIAGVYRQLSDLAPQIGEDILLINAAFLGAENESQWIRLLSALSLYFSDVIVFNLHYDIIRNIIAIRRSISDQGALQFWNNESRVLFYSYKELADRREIRRYGATLLTGASQTSFDILNKNIWRHHYSFRKDFLKEPSQTDGADSRYVLSNSKLFHADKLLYFELLIKNKYPDGNELTIFEHSVQFSLNKEFNAENNYDTNNKGYKISDTHFRLGSKIHIKDFYYAKRLFQNSFFTTPFSYLISKAIVGVIAQYDDELLREDALGATDPVFKMTIIGYEDYSSFLTSTIRNILSKNKHVRDLRIEFNHNTIKDGRLSKGLETVSKNILILVPIASSFSTSLKIKNQLDEIFRTQESYKYASRYFILPESLNLILVGHRDEHDRPFERMASEKQDEDAGLDFFLYDDELLNRTYNWVSINRNWKTVRLKSFNGSNEDEYTFQRYFIPVYTSWKDADNCDLCNPDDIVAEKCLIETGRTSITPTLIFGYPKVKSCNDYGRNPLDLRHSLLYGNITKGRNNYLYFSRSGQVVSNNRQSIIEWLRRLKKDVFNESVLAFKKVVLLTPATGTKSNFIDLVNEYLFEYTANCLTISLGEDYIENTESLYADGLHQADIVIFVDDVLSSINSFLEINYIVKYIRNKYLTGRGIDFCISLINRMSYDCEDNLMIKLPSLNAEEHSRLLYFAKLNNAVIEEPDSEFPLAKERKRYNALAETSSLDAIRLLFLTKLNKLEPVDIEESVPNRIRDDVAYFDKKLFQLLVLHHLYNLFEIRSATQMDSGAMNYEYQQPIHDFFHADQHSLENLINFILNGLANDSHHKDIIEKYAHNVKYVILKLLCSTPLVYYKGVRNAAFQWVLYELEGLRKEMEFIDRKKLATFFEVTSRNYFSKFQRLKFLLKRSVQLKSNYIFHLTFLRSLEKFMDMLYEQESMLNLEFAASNRKIFDQLTNLFVQTDYTPGKIEVAKYLKELEALIMSEAYTTLIEDIDQKELEVAAISYNTELIFDPKREGFYRHLKAIKEQSKYTYVSVKKFIYQLVSLVQELIEEHETKAIRLEKNLKLDLWSKPKYNPTDDRNGNFNHYLRLLKLENTAIIERFWEHYRLNESANGKKTISIINIRHLFGSYRHDPKFKVIRDDLIINCEDAFKGFLTIKSMLYNWGAETNKQPITGNDLKYKINQLLKQVGIMLGNQVISAHLTVNYNSLESANDSDLYVFAPCEFGIKPPVHRILEDDESLKGSLTRHMFESRYVNGAEHSPSNIEIYKTQAGIRYRENIINDKLMGSFSEIKTLSKLNSFSLLAIRLSDIKESKTLFTQAVLTIVSESGERVDERKLRLLLLLRKSLSEFIKSETSSNTFLELLENRTIMNYQRHLKHGIGDFISNQVAIVQDYEQIGRKIEVDDEIEDVKEALELEYIKKATFPFKEFLVVTNSINSQMGISTKKHKGEKVFFYAYFMDLLYTIYFSERLGKVGSLDVCKVVKFLNPNEFDKIKLPVVIVNSLIPELILNQKKYGVDRTINWKDNKTEFELIFGNRISDTVSQEVEGYGLKMCKEVEKLEDSRCSISMPVKPYGDYFLISIKIKR
ncbi:hypothetical protein [Mucilaginibacter kameinonensis]|uniref:hypothetical protein n=1 Tax=Mucilaginibacter kameinonensis TaxID=452286 RepID=UPI000EF76111|nr:hypothetical protein [Mucilaginibacter kameinonensis]